MYRVARRVLLDGRVRRGLKEAIEDVVQSVMTASDLVAQIEAV
jgi:hypothetical protein